MPEPAWGPEQEPFEPAAPEEGEPGVEVPSRLEVLEAEEPAEVEAVEEEGPVEEEPEVVVLGMVLSGLEEPAEAGAAEEVVEASPGVEEEEWQRLACEKRRSLLQPSCNPR